MGGSCSILPSCASRETTEEESMETFLQPIQTAPQSTAHLPSLQSQDLVAESSSLQQVRPEDEISNNDPRLSNYVQEYQKINCEIANTVQVMAQCEIALAAARRKSDLLKASIELYGGNKKLESTIENITSSIRSESSDNILYESISNISKATAPKFISPGNFYGESSSTMSIKDTCVSNLDTKFEMGIESLNSDMQETTVQTLNVGSNISKATAPKSISPGNSYGESSSKMSIRDTCVNNLDTKSEMGIESLNSDTQRTSFQTLNAVNSMLKVAKTKKIADSEIKKLLPANWNTCKPNTKLKTNLRIRLDPECAEYEEIKSAFTENNTKQAWRLQSINRLENPFTYLMYLLKKEEYNLLYPDKSSESSHFHGTQTQNVAPIVNNNFNWRLSKRSSCGLGVSFNVTACNVMAYSEKLESGNKIIMAEVLQANTCKGTPEMTLPPNGFDSSESKGGAVTVKYDDNTFYPKYLITFRGKGK